MSFDLRSLSNEGPSEYRYNGRRGVPEERSPLADLVKETLSGDRESVKGDLSPSSVTRGVEFPEAKKVEEVPVLSKRRKRVSYSTNVTPAVAWDCTKKEIPIGKRELTVKEESYLRQVIKDHANRRISLFYAQLVAYHDEHCTIDIAKTTLQHGIRRDRYAHQAAHYCILPSLRDNFLDTLIDTIFAYGKIPEKEKEELLALGVPEEKLLAFSCYKEDENREVVLKSRDEIIQELDLAAFKKSLLPQDSYLAHAMNATTEIPEVVNHFDGFIEKEMRPVALHILNAVSQGVLDPNHALHEFVDRLNAFFDQEERSMYEVIEIMETLAKAPVFGKKSSFEEMQGAIQINERVKALQQSAKRYGIKLEQNPFILKIQEKINKIREKLPLTTLEDPQHIFYYGKERTELFNAAVKANDPIKALFERGKRERREFLRDAPKDLLRLRSDLFILTAERAGSLKSPEFDAFLEQLEIKDREQLFITKLQMLSDKAPSKPR